MKPQNNNNRNNNNGGSSQTPRPRNSQNFKRRTRPQMNVSRSALSASEQLLSKLAKLRTTHYLERRNLTSVLQNNKKFHLITLKNFHKSMPIHANILDFCQIFPQKEKHLVSVHIQTNENDSNFYNLRLGLDDVSLFNYLHEVFGVNAVQIYKSEVSMILPRLNESKDCEYNLLYDDPLVSSNQTYKLRHEPRSTVKILKIIEDIVKDRIFEIKNICTNHKVTYISFTNNQIQSLVSNVLKDMNITVEVSETVTMYGTLPSSLTVLGTSNVPNSSGTACMRTVDLINQFGWKRAHNNIVVAKREGELKRVENLLYGFEERFKNFMERFVNRVSDEQSNILSTLSQINRVVCNNTSELDSELTLNDLNIDNEASVEESESQDQIMD